MKKGCIFDLDGTLVNSLMDLGESVNMVLAAHGLEPHPIEAYNLMVGNGVRKLVQRALNGRDDLLDECLNEFYKVYEENCLNNTVAYDGIYELIEHLKEKDIKLGVVTNKPHHLAIKIVEALFPDTFTAIYGQQNLYPVKPNPQSTHIALMTMRVRKEDCIFIGDSNVDIDTAINAGLESIGVLWGFRDEKELLDAGANYIAHSANDIERIVCDDYCS